jgi:hypothetical protein
VAALVAVFAVAGGVVAWAVTRHTGHPSANASHPVTAHPATHAPSTPVQPTTSTPSPSPTPTRTGLVSVAPGVAQQGDAPAVAAFLNNYFTAINNHDYQKYRRLLDAQLRRQLTAGNFNSGYRATVDSAATLTALGASGSQVAAAVAFTSHQPPADSPTHTRCTRWTITLYLSPQGSSYVIGSPPSNYHASYHAC